MLTVSYINRQTTIPTQMLAARAPQAKIHVPFFNKLENHFSQYIQFISRFALISGN